MTTTAQRSAAAAILSLIAVLLLCWSAPPAGAFPQGQLVFESQQPDSVSEISVINLDGGARQSVTSNDLTDESPEWSPDGASIAETRQVSTSPSRYNVIIMNTDGSAPHEIDSGDYDNGPGDWAPDGVHLVIGSYRDGSAKIYLVNDDGSGAVNLSGPGEVYDYEPAVSPDGNMIAFSSERSGDREIWVMGANGENPTRLTYTGGASSYSPAWSRDSSTIIYTSFRTDPSELWAINADGFNDHQISFLHDQGGAGDGEYSPDGGFIAFTGSDGIYTMAAAGDQITRVPGTTSNDRRPAWRPALVAGDADCNKQVNLLDAFRALQSQAGAPAGAAGCLAAANVKCDDALNSTDIALILAFAAEIPADVPSGCKDIEQSLG